MENKEPKEKVFLETQLQWTKEQIAILDEMDNKLLEMKKIAVYAAENNLSEKERANLNLKLEKLKKEFDSLEALRHKTVH